MSRRFRHVEALGDKVFVAIPPDETGFLGRECFQTECEGYFKVKPGTGLSGPGLLCHCPYCGHTGDPNSFWTKAQIEYAKSVVFRRFTDAVRKDLKQFEFNYPARGAFGIGISMKLQPGSSVPIRHYREQQLETEVICESCTLHYSVFGLFAYCPDCRVHNSLQVLQRNLVLVEKQLALAASIDNPDLSRHLVEDAIENCVSAFDGFAREACRVRAAHSTNPNRAVRLSFQNLSRASSDVNDLFRVDLATGVSQAAWAQMERAFYKRHLLAHCSGIIDDKYLQTSGDATAVVGRRVSITPSEVAEVSTTVNLVGANLVRLLPAP